MVPPVVPEVPRIAATSLPVCVRHRRVGSIGGYRSKISRNESGRLGFFWGDSRITTVSREGTRSLTARMRVS